MMMCYLVIKYKFTQAVMVWLPFTRLHVHSKKTAEIAWVGHKNGSCSFSAFGCGNLLWQTCESNTVDLPIIPLFVNSCSISEVTTTNYYHKFSGPEILEISSLTALKARTLKKQISLALERVFPLPASLVLLFLVWPLSSRVACLFTEWSCGSSCLSFSSFD